MKRDIWRRQLPIRGIVITGVWLRGLLIGQQSLWLDELFSVFLVQHDWADVIRGTANDILPPFYYALLKIALYLGHGEVVARLISWFFSALTIPVLYVLAARLFNRRTGLVASLLLTLNPLHIAYAQEARMYTQFAFFTLLATYFFWRAWWENQRHHWIFFTIATIVNFYTHSLAFLNLLALDIYVLSQYNLWPQRWRRWLMAHLVLGLAFMPWLTVILQQTTRLDSEFSGASQSLLTLLVAIYLFLFSVTLPIYLVPVAMFAGLALIAFALLALYHRRSVDRTSPLIFSLLIFIVPVLGLYLISLVQPIFVERRLLPATLGLYLLLAWTITQAPPRRLNVALGIVVTVTMVVAFTGYYFNPETQKTPMRRVAERVAAQVEPGDTVIHTTDTSALAFAYYAPSLPNHFLAGDPDYVAQTNRGRAQRIVGLWPQSLEAIVAGRERVWLVVTLDNSVAYQTERVAEFDETYPRLDHQNIGGVEVLLYDVSPN